NINGPGHLNRIGRITTAGVITTFPAADGATGITVGADGALWFVEADTTNIGRITTAGSFTQFSAHNNANRNGGDITGGPDGNLWFTESLNIGRMTTAGVITAEFPAPLTDFYSTPLRI